MKKRYIINIDMGTEQERDAVHSFARRQGKDTAKMIRELVEREMNSTVNVLRDSIGECK